MDFNKVISSYFPLIFISLFLSQGHAQARPVEILSSGELQIALQKLNVLGAVLYIAAHPDDENTNALAYFSQGKKYRTGILTLTRGDGGQNLLGAEKGAEIGIIRTQELLEGRKYDKVEQYFTRAIDFGYSKNREETLEFWGQEQILADMVWVIRKFRPDVIISRSLGGHGNHAAEALLTPEAFTAAGDPKRFPEQLAYIRPWQANRLLLNRSRFNPGTQQELDEMIKIDVGAYDPLLNKSYTEIAAISRSMHKTQGFGAVTTRPGTRNDFYRVIDGATAESDIFDGIDVSWDRIPGGARIGTMLSHIINTFDPNNPSKSIPQLLAVNSEFNQLSDSYWVDLKQQELYRVIQACAGLWMEALSDEKFTSPGDEIQIQTTLVNRTDYPLKIESIDYAGVISDSKLNIVLANNDPVTIDKTFRIPPEYPISQPYWLMEEASVGAFSISEQNLIGLAENPPPITVNITLSIDGNNLEYSLPLSFRWTDRVEGNRYSLIEIRPAVTLSLEEKVYIFPDNNPREISVNILNNSEHATGEIRLRGDRNWKIEPASIPFALKAKYEEMQVIFRVTPPRGLSEGVLTAEADINGKVYNRDIVEISYPHIDRQSYFPVSQAKAVKININLLGNRLGYIMGSGDDIPEALRSLKYDVVLLDDDMLENLDLSQFDAIIAGVRAYNTREQLVNTQYKIMSYVEAGGTYIVQYNRPRGLLSNDIGPYAFTISRRDRVSDETAPISFLKPAHQLLNFPNKISQKDFEGWVQERGLNFLTQWDERYETILSSHDPNEPNRAGGMLFTRYGNGVFIYTGYAWFRQLPAGVPGAYRFFVNMIAAGQYHGN